MKKWLIVWILVWVGLPTNAQTEIDDLLEQGVAYAEQGLYEQALEIYLEVEHQLPDNDILLYEIGLLNYYLENYQTAIEYAEKVMRLSQEDYIITSAILIKGNSLDLMGKPQESIHFYLTMLELFPEDNMLYYNLAYTYYTQGLLKEAEESVINSIIIAPEHSSSHLLLAYIHDLHQNRVQTCLALHFFLFLEPFSDRSAEAYLLLDALSKSSVAVNENDPQVININFNPEVNKEFSTAEMMISLLEVNLQMEKNLGKTDEELFVEMTRSTFKILGEMGEKREETDETSIWWDFYIPLFYEIAKTEHIEAYCMFISQGVNPQAKEWLDENPEKLEAFSQWFLTD